jgi:hypothetical protein
VETRMTTRTLAMMGAAVEITAGSALIVSPTLVVHLLIGASVASGGIAVGRVGGMGLLSLGLACWPRADVVTAQATSAMFTYNLLSALYIGYLNLVGGFFGYLLWPAFALHGLLALLLAYPAFEAVRREWLGIPFPKNTMRIASEVVLGQQEKAERTSEEIRANSH